MYLKRILNDTENSLLKQTYNSQSKSPSSGDWLSETKLILKELEIILTLNEIKEISKNKFKKIVKSAIENQAFKYLKTILKQKQKGRLINYTKFELQPYLRSKENIPIILQRQLFALRSQMNNIKANFCSRTKIPICDQCENEIDNNHLFKCMRETKNIKNINYNHILNGTILQKKSAIEFLNRMDQEEKKTQG